ncbi:MAG: Cell division ATP-binding protein FtsE [Parcubacteria group bacterium GW2011_GWC1_42_11]|uniref:Cell division ATP-binding protein FtsE n=1 Tax=Candidatus Nomurabacteria bacterium GW2011_GWC2_42_20 TaxID=1618756 RepID=A0A0G1BQ23_9BACT|nr:MAG: Cell division ATP-binding protein FtsE [Parcubacteria group bacterium GW2011_GWC1_42_11]KKS48331.1 MAG: Cell division ATP-binding protein FtsE [Candidatus Nomurabacteria bacterium GW2011_GWC2_42_20]KKT09907.1 MAG: Cell division ATP-binding protein FtsE [Candidatus Nomurabacteria bacterium GW2011_GWB1_43_20]TAN35594.1 MAG: cell division ATP-binding protein FtsE [Patescibacteria group bacterium]
MIYFDNVSKSYQDGTVALNGVTLSIKQGEFVSIVGHSGAGKTTLVKLLLGEDNPTTGSVSFDSVNIKKIKAKDMPELRRRIGVIFQDFRLLPNKTAYENVAFAMEVAGKADEEIASDVPHVLELVDLTKKMWNFPRQLSGGELQRVAIARAIVNQPDLIIADEPTGNLDPINTYEIVQILKKINDMGTTVILTTHNKGVVEALGKRVITMDHGRIIRDDSTGKYAL